MKKVLMITYDFPPARTSGIYRPVKFVKHLAKFGWEPVVLTVKNPYVPAYDHTLLKDIPKGTKIYSSRTVDLAKVNDDIHKFLFGNNSAEPAPSQSRNSDSNSNNDSISFEPFCD